MVTINAPLAASTEMADERNEQQFSILYAMPHPAGLGVKAPPHCTTQSSYDPEMAETVAVARMLVASMEIFRMPVDLLVIYASCLSHSSYALLRPLQNNGKP